jgi:hypothetical protein
MDYRIIKADAKLGQIEVTYVDKGVDIATYTIDVPIVNGAYISGAALEDVIQKRAPLWLVDRLHSVQSAAGFENILAQVIPPVAPVEPVIPVIPVIPPIVAVPQV